MDRRAALFGSLTAFATYALVREAIAATPAARSLPVKRWIARQDELARGIAGGTVSQREWHDAVNVLAREVDVGLLAAEIAHAKTRPADAPFGHDPVKRFVTFVGDDGEPMRVAYGAALFTFARDSVITPHAHKHMASAHMVIAGKVRIRTFDRVGEIASETGAGAIIIRPMADEIAEPGMAAAMTTAQDNVHWFAARSETAMTFDVIVDGLDAGQPDYLIQPIDPVRGERTPAGDIVAPILTFEESSRNYTAAM